LGAVGEDAEGGARLMRLLPEGAAEKAGLHEGDLVKSVDKKPVEGFQQLLRLLQEYKEGDKVTVHVLRGTEDKDIALTVGSPTGGGRGATARRPYGSGLGGQEENAQEEQGADGVESGGRFRSSDGGDTWARVNSINPRPMYFSQVRVDPSDDKYVYVLGVSQYRSSDGGKTFTADLGRGNDFGRPARAAGGAGGPTGGFGGGGGGGPSHSHAPWVAPHDRPHLIIRCHGGFYASYDRGGNWDHVNTMAIGQFYHVAVDSRPNYKVYGGLQDNGSWGGPSRTHNGPGPINEDWVSVGGGDGFVCRVDANDPD